MQQLPYRSSWNCVEIGISVPAVGAIHRLAAHAIRVGLAMQSGRAQRVHMRKFECSRCAAAELVKLRRPYCLVGAGCALLPPRSGLPGIRHYPLPNKNRGRAGRCRVRGPAGLDASRHRGLSKPIVPQVRQSFGVPRAVFIGLLRTAPGGRTFQATSASPRELQAAYPPCWPRPPLRSSDRMQRDAITGPGDARMARRARLRLGPPDRGS